MSLPSPVTLVRRAGVRGGGVGDYRRAAGAAVLALAALSWSAAPGAAQRHVQRASLPIAEGGADHAAAARTVSEFDLFRFVWIADPQISPDGSQIVFVRETTDSARTGYETSLWIVPTDGHAPPRPFTSGPRDGSPRWSPDGKRVAFTRAEQMNGSRQPSQIYVIGMDGGEARAVTRMPHGAGTPVWSPDGRTIAFTASSGAEPQDTSAQTDSARARTAAAADSIAQARHTSDVRVISRAVYRFNGAGYLDPTRHTHIYTVAVPGAGEPPATAAQITSGRYDEDDVQWSRDGSRLYFTSTRVDEPYYAPSDNDLYAVSARGGDIERVASIDGSIGAFSVSLDGKRIAFVGALTGEPERSHSQSDLFVVDAAGGTPRNLTAAYDYDIGGGLAGDQHAPRGGTSDDPLWTRDGRAILVRAAVQGRTNLQRVDAGSGAVTAVTTGDQEVVGYTADAGAARLVALVSTPTMIGDLFVLPISGARGATMSRVTNVNDSLFSQLTLTAPEELWYTSFDGRRIQGWIQKPPGFDPSHTYPVILEIHGGPHAAYGYTFYHEIQWMAAKGYVVLYVNPRGSTSYGQEFGNIIQYHYPGDDYKDLMIGVDTLVARGYVDAKRLGVTGGSGGGLLTNWVVTQTHRFAAAVSQRSIADWGGFWFTADFSLFTPSWFRAAPWEDPKDYAARSPITYVGNVTTPLMLIVGDADYRTPAADGGEQMFRALKYLHKPTVMVRFPRESHELSRSGEPWHRVERLQHIVGWFDKYLMGAKTTAYDVVE